MALNRSWIIGSAPECDQIVDFPTVSGRHCRLIRTDDGYLLEDLRSTNGTFVNGQRIDRPTPVTRRDRVTLGRETPMNWPDQADSDGLREIIRVGRDPSNEIVLDGAMVSGLHAQIILEAGGAVIEDLGSSNGTALNAPDRRITRAVLDPSDVAMEPPEV